MILPEGNGEYSKFDTQGETVTKRQQAVGQEKTTIICNKVATKIIKTHTHTHKPQRIAHTLYSRDIKFKIRECAKDKHLLDNFLTMILNRIIHQPLLNTSEAFSSP